MPNARKDWWMNHKTIKTIPISSRTKVVDHAAVRFMIYLHTIYSVYHTILLDRFGIKLHLYTIPPFHSDKVIANIIQLNTCRCVSFKSTAFLSNRTTTTTITAQNAYQYWNSSDRHLSPTWIMVQFYVLPVSIKTSQPSIIASLMPYETEQTYTKRRFQMIEEMTDDFHNK